MAKVKKFLFPGTTFIISFYISALFATGMIIGCLGTVLLQRKFRFKSVFFGLGKWRIHFHHWLMGALILLLFWLAGLFQFLPKVCLGMVGGLVFHDIYFDKKWYKVVLRRK